MVLPVMTGREAKRALTGEFPGRFSTEPGIDLSEGRSREVVRWFLASVLFGARISETIVTRTLRELVLRSVVSPGVILKTAGTASWRSWTRAAMCEAMLVRAGMALRRGKREVPARPRGLLR